MPGFNTINELRENIISRPIIKTHSYLVEFSNVPVPGPWSNTLLVENVTLPGRSIATVERRRFGPQYDMPYERVFSGDLEMTFVYQAGPNNIREALSNWMDKVIDPDTNDIKSGRSEYVGQCDILLFDNDRPVYNMTVDEVFPKLLSPIQLSYGENDNYVRQPVSFSFRSFKEIYNT